MSTLDNVYDQARQLGYDEQLSLLGKLAENIRKSNPQHNSNRHTLLPLAGLGAEVWADVDVEDYVKKEREW